MTEDEMVGWHPASPGLQADSLPTELPGRDWRQEEKGVTEDEMVGWHH